MGISKREHSYKSIQKALPTIQKNICLADQTTFRIGGPAKYFFEARTKKDLIEAVRLAKSFNLPWFILGGGSNILVSDEGYSGVVVKILNSKFQVLNSKIMAEAGVRMGQLVGASIKSGLTGLEWAAGIPGTIGGAVRGNAAAFAGTMKNVVRRVEVFDSESDEVFWLSDKDCCFSYRASIFKQNPNLIVLSAETELKKGEPALIQKTIKEYLDYRREHHPLNFPSAGSIFQNFTPHQSQQGLVPKPTSSAGGSCHPVGMATPSPREMAVAKGDLAMLPERTEGEAASRLRSFNKLGPSRDWWGARKLRIKNQRLLKEFLELKEFNKKNEIPAGFLIDRCGLKGATIGRAQISEKHANFIVNLGGAKAKDVLTLIQLAKRKVKEKFGLTLQEEISFLGGARPGSNP